MEIGLNQITEILPHRDPFLFPTRVTTDAETASGEGYIDFSSLQPIWNSTFDRSIEQKQELLLESAAQIFGVVLASQSKKENSDTQDEKHLLLGFEKIKFPNSIKPSSEIRITTKLIGNFGQMYKAEIKAETGNQIIMSGILSVLKG